MADIRLATANDWREYRDIRLRALATEPDAYGSTFSEESRHLGVWWRARVARAHTLVAWSGARAVGTAVGIADPHEAGSKEIVAVWVEPEVRGQGVGESLIRAQVAWATSTAASAIALWVSDGNHAARRLYERCGFTATNEREVVRGDLWEERMRRPLP